jgi:DNA-binding transcriptional regulator YdaS (Cro superfamily)
VSLKIRLQLFLEETGTTQAHVAKSIGMHRVCLNQWLKGHRPLPPAWIDKVDQYLIQCGY